jgi:hypothetical protein
MGVRTLLLVVLVVVAVWQGWLTFLQYTFVPPPPYTITVCTGRDYARGTDVQQCTQGSGTVSLRDERAAGALIQVAYKGYHGLHDVTLQVDRAAPDGSWMAGPAWFGPGASGDESNPATWVYRASLTLFWPPPWDTHDSDGVLTQAGIYRIHVTLDGKELPTYSLTVIP